MISQGIEKKLAEYKTLYPARRSALIPSLHELQREYGWLSQDAMRFVAEYLNLPVAIVKSTASFYTLFKLNPLGRHHIRLCTNISCMLCGSEEVKDFLKSRYGLEPGMMTDDGRFSLSLVECIGACGGAPAMLVNEDTYEHISADKVEAILGTYA